MPEKWLVADDELLQAVKEAVREAPAVLPRLVQAARAAYGWHTLDTELAALAYDSALPTSSSALPVTRQLALREDEALLRYLTFVATDLTVEVEVDDARLLGQIAPPCPGEREVWTAESAGGCTAIDALLLLRSPVPTRASRLHVGTADGTQVRRAWIRSGDDALAG